MSAMLLLKISPTTVDLLGNTLSALVSNEIDDIAATAVYNWARTNYNQITTAGNFLVVKSNNMVENILIFSYIYTITQLIVEFLNIE